MMTLLLAAGLLIPLCFWIWLVLPYDWRSSAVAAVIDRIPGPKTLPLIGNALHFNIPHEEVPFRIKEDYQTYGPIFRVWLFGKPMVFLSDPDDVEIVLKSRTQISKSDDYVFVQNLLGTGLLTSTGEKWRSHRKLLESAFHSKNFDDYLLVFNRNSKLLVQRLASMENDPWVDITTWVTLTSLDVISEAMFGVSIHAQRDGHIEYVKSLKRVLEAFHHRTLSPWLHRPLAYNLSISGHKEKQDARVLLNFCEKVVEEKTAERRAGKTIPDDSVQTGSEKKRPNVLELLLESSNTEGLLTDKDIIDEVSTFMFAGEDTTTTAICWALFLLGNNTRVQDEVVEELRELFGSSDRQPDLGDLNNMKSLERVMKEAWRLYPSSPIFSRKTTEDLQLKDYTIPAGTNLNITPFTMHRDPGIFPEPDKFDPDRFLPERAERRHPYAFLPFSAGPRVCIGQRFGLLEEKVVIAAILRNFHVTSLDRPEDVKYRMEITLRPWPVLKINLAPRV